MNTDNQMLLLVDDTDRFSGDYATRKKCHTGKGLHHRAFVVLLENKKGEVLLQKRKHKLWDNYWDTTAISHVLHLKDHDETYTDAALRAMKSEMGIAKMSLEKIGGFNYFAKHGKNCENEYCTILIGNYNGKVKADSRAVYEYQWMKKKEFIQHCLDENNVYTPWAILTGKFLAAKNNSKK
jgi:isopentenyl-diphosphate delta-isomerase type 1